MSSMIASAISGETLNRNRLLALLTPESQRRMLPRLKLMSLEINRPLYEPHELSIPLYFPLTAVISVFSEMGATVGREGMVGLSRFLQDETMVMSCVELPGTALWMELDDFQDMVDDKKSGLESILLRYSQALLGQLAQQSACNRSHTIDRRCARWILMTQDRVGRDELALTVEFLGYMLSERRGSVSIACGSLARNGLIKYTRKNVSVLKRARLEEASCECYGVIQREYERLIGKDRAQYTLS
jgi:CRP-like cAMP-binding protein